MASWGERSFLRYHLLTFEEAWGRISAVHMYIYPPDYYILDNHNFLASQVFFTAEVYAFCAS
jgi:hypothetical protein